MIETSGFVNEKRNSEGLGFFMPAVSAAIPRMMDEMDVVEVDGKMEWDDFFKSYFWPKDEASAGAWAFFIGGWALRAAGVAWIANRLN